VIARLPEPISALRARLYTDEFFGELRRAMTPRSVLCLTAVAAPGRLTGMSAQYLASIRATLLKHFPHIIVGWGNPAHIMAATEPELVSTDPAELARRYAARNVQSDLFRPDWFAGGTDWLEPEKLRRRKAELDAAVSTISTDLHPVVYLQRLALWEEMTGGRSHAIFERLRSVGCTEFIVALLGVAGATLLVSYVRAGSGQRRRRQAAGSRNGVASPLVGDVSGFQPDLRTAWFADSAIILSVGTTGFVTMALSIIFLFAFQNLYGYVYQRIGWIVALFMAGLVVGCGLISWRSRRIRDTAGTVAGLWAGLIAVDGLLTLLALTIPFVLPWLGSLQNAPVTFAVVEWCISLLVLVTGALGGAAFALGGALRLSATGRPGAAAGSVVGADHVGACLGALLCGIVLVPVFGTATAAFLLAGIKLSSAALLTVGRWVSRAV
jgi:spermidine synthase